MYVDYINVQLLPASYIRFVLLNSTFAPVSNCSHKLTNSCVNMLAAIVHMLLSGTEECEDTTNLNYNPQVQSLCNCILFVCHDVREPSSGLIKVRVQL